MPRKAATVEDEGEDGNVEKFLDGLPGDDKDPDDDDADDSDEKEDDGDGGDDSGEGLPIAASAPTPRRPGRPPSVERDTPAPTRPRGIRGPRSLSPEARAASPALNALRSFQDSAYQELDSIIAGLNFSTREYEIRLERIEPEFDENDNPCSGFIQTYKDKITIGDIEKRHGGGLYEMKIFGPHPTTGRAGIIKRERFKVSGLPKPMKSRRNDDDKKSTEISEVLRAITDSNERSQQRVVELLERQNNNPSAISEILPVVTPLLEKLLSKNEDSTRAVLEAQREERRQDERRRDEERKSEEEKKKEEREERRREEDRRRDDERRAEEKRREDDRKREDDRREALREERERQKDEREQERQRLREELEREREARKEEAAEKQRQHEREMALAAERAKQDAQRQSEFLTMMQTFTQAQMDALQMRSEGGGLDSVTKQLMMLNDLRGVLTGSDQEPSTIEKFQEGLDGVVKTILPVGREIMTAMQNRRPQQPQQMTATVQPPRPVVVDLGPARAALPQQPAPQPQQPIQNPSAPSGAPFAVSTSAPPIEGQAQEQQQASGPPNDLTEFRMPTEADDLQTAGILLMKNVDLAVQKNMTPQQIVEKILDPFEQTAPMLAAMAGGMGSEQLIEFVEANVPSEWAICSPRGEQLVVDAFELWNADDAA